MWTSGKQCLMHGTLCMMPMYESPWVDIDTTWVFMLYHENEGSYQVYVLTTSYVPSLSCVAMKVGGEPTLLTCNRLYLNIPRQFDLSCVTPVDLLLIPICHPSTGVNPFGPNSQGLERYGL